MIESFIPTPTFHNTSRLENKVPKIKKCLDKSYGSVLKIYEALSVSITIICSVSQSK